MAQTNAAPSLLAPENTQRTLIVPSGVTLVLNFEGPGPHTLNLNLHVSTSLSPHRPRRPHRPRTLIRPAPYSTPVRSSPVPYGRRLRLAYDTPARVKSESINSPLFEPISQPQASPAVSERSNLPQESVTEYDSDGTEQPPVLNVFQHCVSRELDEGMAYLNGHRLGLVQVINSEELETTGGALAV
ncbi:hypothetical protein C8F01DRAFT_2477 [Mycena amicta]|nr:hypothetical protein C8F01DRAFT_2477 [Mycena amicta]